MAKESENYCAPDRGTQLLLLQPVPGAVQELQLLLLLLLSAQVFHNFKILFLGHFLLCKERLFQFMGQVVKKHLDLEKYIFPSKTLLPDFLSKFLLPDFVRKMGQFVKVREMWVTGGANSLPHPFLERPKVRLTHWYGVVSHFVKPRVKNWALSKLARHKY